jgi:hypothetical protein
MTTPSQASAAPSHINNPADVLGIATRLESVADGTQKNLATKLRAIHANHVHDATLGIETIKQELTPDESKTLDSFLATSSLPSQMLANQLSTTAHKGLEQAKQETTQAIQKAPEALEKKATETLMETGIGGAMASGVAHVAVKQITPTFQKTEGATSSLSDGIGDTIEKFFDNIGAWIEKMFATIGLDKLFGGVFGDIFGTKDDTSSASTSPTPATAPQAAPEVVSTWQFAWQTVSAKLLTQLSYRSSSPQTSVYLQHPAIMQVSYADLIMPDGQVNEPALKQSIAKYRPEVVDASGNIPDTILDEYGYAAYALATNEPLLSSIHKANPEWKKKPVSEILRTLGEDGSATAMSGLTQKALDAIESSSSLDPSHLMQKVMESMSGEEDDASGFFANQWNHLQAGREHLKVLSPKIMTELLKSQHPLSDADAMAHIHGFSSSDVDFITNTLIPFGRSLQQTLLTPTACLWDTSLCNDMQQAISQQSITMAEVLRAYISSGVPTAKQVATRSVQPSNDIEASIMVVNNYRIAKRLARKNPSKYGALPARFEERFLSASTTALQQVHIPAPIKEISALLVELSTEKMANTARVFLEGLWVHIKEHPAIAALWIGGAVWLLVLLWRLGPLKVKALQLVIAWVLFAAWANAIYFTINNQKYSKEDIEKIINHIASKQDISSIVAAAKPQS